MPSRKEQKLSPYISSPRREAYAHLKQEIKKTRIDTVGELTYLFDLLADLYMSQHMMNYENLNAVVGSFECAKLEFWRRVTAPYEDTKIESNGALLDAQLLAEVYLAMTRGQDSLISEGMRAAAILENSVALPAGSSEKVTLASAEELAAHQEYLEALNKSGNCVWMNLEKTTSE